MSKKSLKDFDRMVDSMNRKPQEPPMPPAGESPAPDGPTPSGHGRLSDSQLAAFRTHLANCVSGCPYVGVEHVASVFDEVRSRREADAAVDAGLARLGQVTMENATLRSRLAEQAKPMECGHHKGCVSSSDEGTSYCVACAAYEEGRKRERWEQGIETRPVDAMERKR